VFSMTFRSTVYYNLRPLASQGFGIFIFSRAMENIFVSKIAIVIL
jgi:hypothetical protein